MMMCKPNGAEKHQRWVNAASPRQSSLTRKGKCVFRLIFTVLQLSYATVLRLFCDCFGSIVMTGPYELTGVEEQAGGDFAL